MSTCYKTILIIISSIIIDHAKAVCPFGWLKFGKSCYLFHRDTNLSWQESSEYCRTHGGYLATVDSSDEKDYINGMIQNDPGHYWLGGIDDRKAEGIWEWSNTGDQIATDLWYPGEPNSLSPLEDCMETATKYDGFWNDEQCHFKQYCICKRQYV